MKKIIESYICDICKKEISEKDVLKIRYPAIFITEQTEGIKTKPYIDYVDIDICKECGSKVLNIIAEGCQGYNKYRIKKEDE